MSEKTACRGRPKGSGIDDSRHLEEIARLIDTNPSLKPTTAIRTLGVSDPSVIRRLRDKFSVARQEFAADLAKAAPRASAKPKAAQSSTVTGPARNDNTRPAAAKRERPRSVPAAVVSGGEQHCVLTAAKSAGSAAPRSSARRAKRAPRSAAALRPPLRNDDSERLRVMAPQGVSPAGAAPLHSREEPARDFQLDVFAAVMRTSVFATEALLAVHSAMAREIIRSPFVAATLRQHLAFGIWAAGFLPASRHPTKTAT
jgi:hypothetical protein